jgi:HSP20 family molecular chaperone IbpA
MTRTVSRSAWLDSPYLLGFERLQELAERVAHIATDGYPPYNVESFGEGSIRVTLAVAGFALEELSIELDDRRLTVAGDKNENGADRAYLHRGIATRRFRKEFLLADGYEVEEARLENGLLHVALRHQERARDVIRIPIQAGAE